MLKWTLMQSMKEGGLRNMKSVFHLKGCIHKYWNASINLALRNASMFLLLLLAWMLPALRFQTFVHECGHVLSYNIAGDYSYGVFLDPFPGIGGSAPHDKQINGTIAGILASLSGTSAAALFGLLLLPLGAKLSPRSTLRVFIALCAGIGFLEFLWYPLYSFYSGHGDFNQWPDQLGALGRWLMPLLYLSCFPLGFGVGGWFFKTVDAWLPASSVEERVILALFTIGVPYAAGIALSIFKIGYNQAIPGIQILTGIGGFAAIYRLPLKSAPTPVRYSLIAFLIPLCLALATEILLFASGGYIPMPVSSFNLPPASPSKYADTRLIALPREGLLAADSAADIFCSIHNALYRFGSDANKLEKVWEANEGQSFSLTKCHDGKVYMNLYERIGPGNKLIPSILTVDLKSKQVNKILNNVENLHAGLDVSEDGDIFFAQKERLMRLSNGADKPIVVREDIPNIMWIRVGPMDWIYLFLLPKTWPASRDCLVVRVSRDGRFMEELTTDIAYSAGLDVDSKGNVYLASGLSVIQLCAPDYHPLRMGGVGLCGSPTLLRGGDIAYCSIRNKKMQIRLLSPRRD